MHLTIGHRRSDGKWPVTLTFPGSPNAFGGHYPGQVYRKLYTPEKLHETVQRHGTEQQRAHYTPARCGLHLPDPTDLAYEDQCAATCGR